jgi:hypothetical protein
MNKYLKIDEIKFLEIKKKSLNPADYVKLNFRNVKEFF